MKPRKKEKIDIKFDLKLYWSILKEYRLLLFGVLVFTLVNEIVNISNNFIYKGAIDRINEFGAGSIIKEVFISALLSLMIIYLSLLVAKVISKWMHIHLLNKLDSELIISLKRKFFNHLVHLSHNFHTSHKTGSLISRLSRGGRAIERMTDILVFSFVPTIVQVVLVFSAVLFFDRMSALIIVITVVTFSLYNIYFQFLQNPSKKKANDTEDIEKGGMADFFTNIDAIKYFGKEDYLKSKFSNLANNTKKAMLKNWGYWRYLDAGQALILGLGTFFVVYFSVTQFLTGGITAGTIVFIYTTYLSLINYMFNFVHGMRDFYNTMIDFDSLFQYAKIENDIKDVEGAKELKIKEGSIEFKDVKFNYGKRKIFSNLSLKIKRNEKIALVGHSGSGKTTLVKILYRFYDLNSGRILIDGSDIRNFKQESLRSEMSVVPQECILFDDTVYNNIAFSNPRASKAEVLKAIKFAQLDKIIEKFPKKEATIVGERGIKLSGGEKQRVSIARAILANKKILVLDEATSSLDSETEYEIQRDLKELMKGRTSIIIAHRLSTIMHADRIIVMKSGKIVQMGSHEELINQPGEYRKLWRLQKGGYIK